MLSIQARHVSMGWHDSAKISRAADEIKKLMSCTLTSSIDILANTSEIQQPSHEYNTALQSSGCTSIAKLVAGCMQQQCASAVHLLFLLSMMNSTAKHAYRHCVHATAMLQGCSACVAKLVIMPCTATHAHPTCSGLLSSVRIPFRSSLALPGFCQPRPPRLNLHTSKKHRPPMHHQTTYKHTVRTQHALSRTIF